jgi:hypothetical protein
MGLQDIKGYMIGILLGIVVLTSGILMFGKLTTVDVTLDSNNDLGKFNKTLALSQNITTAVNALDVPSEKAGVLGWIDTLVHTAFNGMKAIKGSMSFVGVAATESAGVFGLTEINPIIVLITLVVVIIIGIAIYEAIMRV